MHICIVTKCVQPFRRSKGRTKNVHLCLHNNFFEVSYWSPHIWVFEEHWSVRSVHVRFWPFCAGLCWKSIYWAFKCAMGPERDPMPFCQRWYKKCGRRSGQSLRGRMHVAFITIPGGISHFLCIYELHAHTFEISTLGNDTLLKSWWWVWALQVTLSNMPSAYVCHPDLARCNPPYEKGAAFEGIKHAFVINLDHRYTRRITQTVVYTITWSLMKRSKFSLVADPVQQPVQPLRHKIYFTLMQHEVCRMYVMTDSHAHCLLHIHMNHAHVCNIFSTMDTG